MSIEAVINRQLMRNTKAQPESSLSEGIVTLFKIPIKLPDLGRGKRAKEAAEEVVENAGLIPDTPAGEKRFQEDVERIARNHGVTVEEEERARERIMWRG